MIAKSYECVLIDSWRLKTSLMQFWRDHNVQYYYNNISRLNNLITDFVSSIMHHIQILLGVINNVPYPGKVVWYSVNVSVYQS